MNLTYNRHVMRLFSTTFLILWTFWSLNAQFTNNGTVLTIQEGATLRVDGTIQNNIASSIINSGTITLSGNFRNRGIITSQQQSNVNFTGNADSRLQSSGAILQNVQISKDGKNVILQDDLTVAGDITFYSNKNKVALGNNNLLLKVTGDVLNADEDHYILTDGLGVLEREFIGDDSFTFDIGDKDHFTPLEVVVTGSSYDNAKVTSRVYIEDLEEKYDDAGDFIDREWLVTSEGITDYENLITGSYLSSDITGNSSKIKGATFYSDDWHFSESSGAQNKVSALTNEDDIKFSGMNFYAKPYLKAFLGGALSGGEMTTHLNDNNLIPLTSPYSVSPFNAPAASVSTIPDDVTDWILIELRSSADASQVVYKANGFIKKDGTILHLDGKLMRIKEGPETGYIAIKHRNHLAVRSASILDFKNVGLNDFTTSTAMAYTNPSVFNNANMIEINGDYALWPGDVNNDGTVIYNGAESDRTFILSTVGGIDSANTPLTNQYNSRDCNLDGSVIYNGVQSDRVVILSALGAISDINFPILSHTH